MRKFLLTCLIAICFLFAVAQQKTPAPTANKPTDAEAALFSKVKYRLVGPWRGGTKRCRDRQL